MRLVKWGALAGALVIVEALAPPAHGQSARVSIAQAPRAARVLQLMGRGTQIGVTVHDLAADDASKATSGVVIEEVAKDSPAEKAGLKAGDVIVEFDGEHVRSVRQFSRLVQETPDGRKAQAVVMRGGQRTTVSVTPERGDGFMSGDAFERHYRTVADHSPIPVLLYNFTAATGVNLLPETVARLTSHSNIVGMKESGTDAAAFAAFVDAVPSSFSMLAGTGTVFYSGLCLGAVGGILAGVGIPFILIGPVGWGWAATIVGALLLVGGFWPRQPKTTEK